MAAASKNVTFTGSQGAILAAHLDLPDGPDELTTSIATSASTAISTTNNDTGCWRSPTNARYTGPCDPRSPSTPPRRGHEGCSNRHRKLRNLRVDATSLPPCSHSGGRLCTRCSWVRPRQAAVLVLRGRTARRALPVAAVVGTILSAVNLGSVIAGGAATAGTWSKVAVNYAVPFLVASIGYLSGRRAPRQDIPTDWPRYLERFHTQRPAITERLLAQADRSPYAWLVEPLRCKSGLVLDLACGSAPTRDVLAKARWLGLDSSPAELTAAAAAGRTPLVRARADALPLANGSVDAVCAAMCLPVVTPLEDVLTELRRVMRPGATLTALVPSRLGASPTAWLGWLRVMRALGVRGQPWPNPQARDGLAKILRAHGWVVESDHREVFRLDLGSAESWGHLVDALYLPGLDEQRIIDAKRTLTRRERPGRALPLPLRRVVARAPG